jgi:uncharacterized protein (DUF1778 family)
MTHTVRRDRALTRRTPVRRKTKPARSMASGVINLRADAATRALIDQAANALGQNRTDFMLSSARVRAQEVLLSKTHFVLSDADWRRFQAALEQPPVPTAELVALLSSTPPWLS